MDYGFKITTHGEALIAACMDLGAPLKITRAAVGSGLAGGSLANTHTLINYIADASITDRRHEGNLLFLSVQYRNDAHPELEDFVLSEFIVYAQNPETGQETDFVYATLGDSRQPVPGFRTGFPASVWTFPVVLTVSASLLVNITASPGLVTSIDLQDAIDRLKLEIMTNELILPLETADGEALLTAAGEQLLAVYRPDKSAALLERLAAVAGGLEARIARAAADAQTKAQAYADRRAAALAGVDRMLEAQIAAAKGESIAAAEADAEAQIQAAEVELTGKIAEAKAEAVAAAKADAAAQIAKHDESINSHPRFLAVSDEHYDVAYPPPRPDYN